MSSFNAGIIWASVWLCLWSSGCSRPGGSKELSALDSAYQAGVLTKSEYESKKAALQAKAALDKAFEAGVLTKEEYTAKKAALLTGNGLAGNAPVVAAPPASPQAMPDGPMPATSSAGEAPPVPVPQASAAGAGDAQAAGEAQGHTYRMKMAKVMDAQGFDHPIPSVTLLIPVDWQMQGATTWTIKDKCNTIQTHFSASGPQGLAYEVFPAYSWAWADDPKPAQQLFAQNAQMGFHACDVMAPMSAQDYLRRNLARIRPNAQLVGFEPAPKLMEALTVQARQAEQSAQQYKLVQRVKPDAVRARIKYVLDGKPVEEMIYATTIVTGTRGPGLNLQTMQQVQQWSYSCSGRLSATRAPQGQLDASTKLFELIGSTYRDNPEWQAKVSGNALAMQQIELKGVRDRSAIMAKSADDTRIAQRQMYESQSKSEEHNSVQFSQYQRGVETYRNPSSGETFDLDSSYGHAWVSGNGTYLLSDQAGFNPNAVSGNTQTWTQLEHVKR